MTQRDEDALAELDVAPFVGDAYRQQAPGFDPVSGAGARRRGGRYNPPQSFPVLYLALTTTVAAAELRHGAERIGLQARDALPRELYRIDLHLERVVDLRQPEALAALNVTRNDLLAASQLRSRQIGTAASHLGIQALLAPSAAGDGDVIAVFVDNLGVSRCDATLEAEWRSEADLLA